MDQYKLNEWQRWQQCGYEWSHAQRPAKLAGLSQDAIDTLTAGRISDTLPDASRAALEAVVARRSISAEVQQRFVAVPPWAGLRASIGARDRDGR